MDFKKKCFSKKYNGAMKPTCVFIIGAIIATTLIIFF